jgi:hypothetical protein
MIPQRGNECVDVRLGSADAAELRGRFPMTCVWCVRVRIFEAVFAAVFYREVSVVCWTWHATRAASASRPRCVPRFKNTAGAGSRDQG